MYMGLSLQPALVLEQRMEQTLECILRLSLKLEDPFETVRKLFEESQKVRVPIPVGKFRINVPAAIVSENDLSRLFEEERS